MRSVASACCSAEPPGTARRHGSGKWRDNLRRALRAAGSGFDRLVKLNVYVTDDLVALAVRLRLAREFSGGEKPAVSMVETSLKHGSVAMDAIDAATPAGAGLPVARLMDGGLFAANERLAHVAVLPAGPRVYISGQAWPRPPTTWPMTTPATNSTRCGPNTTIPSVRRPRTRRWFAAWGELAERSRST